MVDDYEKAGYVTTLCYTQDIHRVNPLLFTTSREKHVIPKSIKGVVSNITDVDNETAEIDDGEYYLLLALLNGSTGTTSPNEAEEELVAEKSDEQGDEDSISMDAGRQDLSCSFSGI